MNARMPFLKEHKPNSTLQGTLSIGDDNKQRELNEVRRLLRIGFYRALNRNPPFSVAHMPGYVTAVQKHWQLKYRNSARTLLAEIEGFSSWDEMMAVTTSK